MNSSSDDCAYRTRNGEHNWLNRCSDNVVDELRLPFFWLLEWCSLHGSPWDSLLVHTTTPPFTANMLRSLTPGINCVRPRVCSVTSWHRFLRPIKTWRLGLMDAVLFNSHENKVTIPAPLHCNMCKSGQIFEDQLRARGVLKIERTLSSSMV